MTDIKVEPLKEATGKTPKTGALWKKQDKNGKPYLGGTVEIAGVKYRISIFQNGYKTEDRHPDYAIYTAVDQPKQESVPF